MKYIFEFAEGIIVFTLFTNLWEMLIPKGKYAAYIRLVLSFVLIAVILDPLGKLSGKDLFDLFDYNIKVADRQLEMYDEIYYDKIGNEFGNRVTKLLKSKGMTNIIRCESEIEPDENGIPVIYGIDIYANGECDKAEICRHLGIDEAKVRIISEE